MTAEPPQYVAFVSYGNDSVALLQWLHEHGVQDVLCLYSDTGWARDDWPERVQRGEELARSYGYRTARTKPEMPFADLVLSKRMWPQPGKQFCTEQLKVRPALQFLDQIDPDREAVCVVGVRREESRRRAQWPEWVEESDRHGGRSLWSPLVRVREAERNALVERAGFDVLPHRSMECYPCIHANKADLRLLDAHRIEQIDEMERRLAEMAGKPRPMFYTKDGRRGGGRGHPRCCALGAFRLGQGASALAVRPWSRLRRWMVRHLRNEENGDHDCQE